MTGAGGQVSAAYADVEELKGATTEPGKLSVEKSIDGTDNISADALLKRVRHDMLQPVCSAV